MVDDLILLGVQAGGGHNALESLDHADTSRGLNQDFNCFLNICFCLFLGVGRGSPKSFKLLLQSSVIPLIFKID